MPHFLTILLILAPQQETKLDEKKVKELIEKLGSNQIEERDQAEAELTAMGEGVVPFLEKASSDADAETKARIDKITSEVTLARRWAKDLLDEAEPSTAYSKLERALQQKTLDKKQLGRVLTVTLLNDGCSQELRQYLISLAERHKVKEIWPALVQLAQREEDGEYALNYLQRMKPPKEAADAIIKLIPKMKNGSHVLQFLELLRGMKLEKGEFQAAVGSVLESETDDDTKNYILSYIVQKRMSAPLKSLLKLWHHGGRNDRMYSLRDALLRTPPDDSAKEILAWLKAPEQQDVLMAAEYVSRHKIAEAGPALVEALDRYGPEEQAVRPHLIQALRPIAQKDQILKWLDSEGPPSRISVVALIAELDFRALAERLRALLDDKDPAVRKQTVKTLGALRDSGAAGALTARLEDKDSGVRTEALHSLARIQGKAATTVVLTKLLSSDADLQAAALEVLPEMETTSVLDELTKEDNISKHIARYAVAVLIVNGGEAVLHRVMARVGTKISAQDLDAMVRLIRSARGRW